MIFPLPVPPNIQNPDSAYVTMVPEKYDPLASKSTVSESTVDGNGQENNTLSDLEDLIEWSNNNQDGLHEVSKQLEENQKNQRNSELPSQELTASGDASPPTSSVSPGHELTSRSKYELLPVNTPTNNSNSDIARQLRESTDDPALTVSEDAENTDQIKI